MCVSFVCFSISVGKSLQDFFDTATSGQKSDNKTDTTRRKKMYINCEIAFTTQSIAINAFTSHIHTGSIERGQHIDQIKQEMACTFLFECHRSVFFFFFFFLAVPCSIFTLFSLRPHFYGIHGSKSRMIIIKKKNLPSNRGEISESCNDLSTNTSWSIILFWEQHWWS